MSGANASPVGDPDGVGAAAFTIDFESATSTQLCWDLSYSAISPATQAHIHRGVAGQNGPPVVPDPVVATSLAPLDANSSTGCQAISQALGTEIVTTPSNFYVDIHNAEYPGGAIRGQLTAGPPPAGEAH
ncbi:MAG: CHRD domain-containing protein, partial [Ilumatobacteraceae bacterium]